MRAPLLVLTLAACGASSTPGGAAPDPKPAPVDAPAPTSVDVLTTSAGPFEIHPVHHGTVRFAIGDKVVWVDPWSKADLRGPKADLVLVTDIHPDHFDAAAIASVRKDDAIVVAPAVVAEQLAGAVVLANGESRDLGFLRVEAVPMYNLVRGPEPGKLYHDKGRGNGYVLTVGDRRIYLSGDTECTLEMQALRDIDVAFVCMNLPYTMTPTEAAGCVAAFKPKVLYPYHYRDSDLDALDGALAGSGVEVRRRAWY
ncbi:MBL fold metallo-hydrolase [Nannocystis bainbridge]|uniref:MBL fold metallo-hydrolase n=1 Tax=Nannocystis bainbridge TaxID=2995303 RepID=A0ABT5ECU9_9BACT|nr:MBL fold metallo-hydrolase [Nannocystis bainbridge]MDC0723701.1 MBL fold metallo-hydrolase [Nannocystis bainbridge]